MPWKITAEVKSPTRHDMEIVEVGEYPTQNSARWWAVNFAQRGSVSINQGQPNEDLYPMHSVYRFCIREVS